MAAFLEVDGGHNDKVDGLAQFDEVLLGHVFDDVGGLGCEIRLNIRTLLTWLLKVVPHYLFLNKVPIFLLLVIILVNCKLIQCLFYINLIL